MNSLRDSENRLRQIIPVLEAAALALPRESELKKNLADAANAQKRGYFLPDEDERLRLIYAQYLAIRASLHECIQLVCNESLSVKSIKSFEEFLVAFASATQLMRSARYLIDVAEERPVIRKKLDEAEQRYGIGRKTYTAIYKSMTSPRRWIGYTQAIQAYLDREEEALALRNDELMAPVIGIIEEEKDFFVSSYRDFVKRRLRYRLHSWKRRHKSGYNKVMFQLFRISGSAIAEMKNPFFRKGSTKAETKRVTSAIRATMEDHLLPGDVIISRHNDALSNLFLPGFWPHASLYVGSHEQRRALGLVIDQDTELLSVVEAKKDGVHFRALEETLLVDAFTVFRPSFDDQTRKAVVQNALSHVGKLYDFVFDFRQADRLACTAVVYRSYHGQGGMEFELQQQSGRLCLSAEEMMRQMLKSGFFQASATFGVKGKSILFGQESMTLVQQSLKGEILEE